MSDPMAAVGSIRQLSATLADLGPALSQAAPTGSFGSVLSQVSSELAAAEGVAPAATGEAPLGVGQLSAASLLGLPSPEPAGTGDPGEQAVAGAEQFLGVPYVWGGTSPSGFDCSGLVQYVYGKLGVDLPRTSEEQATVGQAVPSLAQAQPGDLVFFAGSDGSASSPGHVGIYAGGGMMIDAPHSGASVRLEPVGHPVAIRRVTAGASEAANPGFGELLGSIEGEQRPAAADLPGMSALGVPAPLQPLFAEAGSRYGVDPLLLAAVARQESGFQTGAVSSAGAQGIMQLMPATAAGLGVSAFDPAQAIDGAAQLLGGYLSRYGGSVPLALAAYNAGPGAVDSYGGVPPFAETRNYVSSIAGMLSGAAGAAVAA